MKYLQPRVASSLYRNGRVLTRRDVDGSDAGTEGVDLEEREVTVHNARALGGERRPTLRKNGFELHTRPPTDPELDFLDHRRVAEDYYPQCADAVWSATGATSVFAFDHNVRSASGKLGKQRIAGGQQVQGPARVVHGDYTLLSGPQRLRDLTSPPGANDTLRTVLGEGESLLDPARVEQLLGQSRRFAIINVWRSISSVPVANHPLALCDAQSFLPEDLVVFEIHYQDRIGENYFAKYSSNHRWFYYPAMTRDEALLIKQWDSSGPLARTEGRAGDASDPEAPSTFSFHTAFEDPTAPADAPERQSIEVRCVALYD